MANITRNYQTLLETIKGNKPKRPNLSSHKLYHGSESEFHNNLKTLAISFLRDMGCSSIRKEVKFHPMNSDNDTYWQRCDGGWLEIDVIGNLGVKTIGVECGGFHIGKKREILLMKLFTTGQLTELYILPYEGLPYKWERNLLVCPHCGHQMGENKQK